MILISAKVLIGVFFSILFLQSGLDKVFNFNGNRSYIASVFEKTFLKDISFLLFIAIMMLETAAGLLSAVGTVYLFAGNDILLLWGLKLSALSLLCLFLGQRIAKDYAGAAGLVSYFLLAVFGISLFI